ncbi:MAG: hypothetical protein MJE68_23640 [Proteobacteria bacterium]|nr:hypothetical protein [Pseudomonadota bacterium]
MPKSNVKKLEDDVFKKEGIRLVIRRNAKLACDKYDEQYKCAEGKRLREWWNIRLKSIFPDLGPNDWDVILGNGDIVKSKAATMKYVRASYKK